MKVSCAHCGKKTEKPTCHVRRSRNDGFRLYCDRTCSGLGRRKHKTKAQKVAEKRLYDMDYRAKNLARITAEKRAYFQRTYDPRKAAVVRKARMHLHVAYCRQPRYRAWKHDYDQLYLAKRRFGPFWESALLVRQLEREVETRMSKHDIRIFNRTYNKVQFRRREYESQRQDTAVRN